MSEIIYLESFNYWQWKKPQDQPANYRGKKLSAGVNFTEALLKLCRYSKCMFKNVKWINNSYWSYVLFLTAITGTLQSAFWKYWKSSRDRIGHSILVQLVEMKWCDVLARWRKESKKRMTRQMLDDKYLDFSSNWTKEKTSQAHSQTIAGVILKPILWKDLNISSEKSSIKWVTNSFISVANYIQSFHFLSAQVQSFIHCIQLNIFWDR